MSANGKINFYLLLTLSLLECLTAQTPIRACNNNSPLPLYVQLNDCVESPCDLPIAQNSTLDIQFVATKDTMLNIGIEAKLAILGNQMPIYLTDDQANVCANLLYGAYCPLDAGEDVTYHVAMPIGDKLPVMSSKLQVDIFDETDKSMITCFVIDTRMKRQH